MAARSEARTRSRRSATAGDEADGFADFGAGGLDRRRGPDRGRDRRWPWVLVPIGGLLIVVVLLGGWLDDGAAEAVPSPSIVLGEVGGAVSTPVPTASPTPAATVMPTPAPTVIPAATPLPTSVPTTPATPAPAATPAPTPVPTTVVVALAQPEDAVAAFYAHVVAEEFDAAYALWSERMKSEFPRGENLDGRFDSTVSMTFTELRTVASDGSRALVQANFAEEYESGASREFVGYWEVIGVDGRWLLDQPHY